MDKWQEQKRTQKKKKTEGNKINQIKLNGLQLMAWRERNLFVSKC